jgi:hypothetical protein
MLGTGDEHRRIAQAMQISTRTEWGLHSHARCLMGRIRAYRSRLEKDLLRQEELHTLLKGATGHYPKWTREEEVRRATVHRDSADIFWFVLGDAEHTLSLLNRLGETVNDLAKAAPSKPRVRTLQQEWRSWFKLVKATRNRIEHAADDYLEGGQLVHLYNPSGVLTYTVRIASGKQTEAQLFPGMVDEAEVFWNEFLDAIAQP